MNFVHHLKTSLKMNSLICKSNYKQFYRTSTSSLVFNMRNVFEKLEKRQKNTKIYSRHKHSSSIFENIHLTLKFRSGLLKPNIDSLYDVTKRSSSNLSFPNYSAQDRTGNGSTVNVSLFPVNHELKIVEGEENCFKTSKPLRENEYVVVRLNKRNGKCAERLLLLTDNHFCSFSSIGRVKAMDVVGKMEGDLDLPCADGYYFSVRRSTLAEYLVLIRRNTAATVPKVLFGMFISLGITKGCRVLESGSGSGVATLILSKLVGKTGHVTSVDRSITSHKMAKANYNHWIASQMETAWPSNVEFVHGDISEYIDDEKYDVVFLDVCDPVYSLYSAFHLVQEGGLLGIYSPSVSKIMNVDEYIRNESLSLVLEDVIEETSVRWKIGSESRTRERPILLSSASDEYSTAFLAKYRKVSDDEQQVSTKNKFERGDQVVVHTITVRKSGKRQVHLFKLDQKSFCNDWGSVASSDIISNPLGRILQTAAGNAIYFTRPTLYDYLHFSSSFRASQKHLTLLIQMMSVGPNASCLAVLDDLKKAILILEAGHHEIEPLKRGYVLGPQVESETKNGEIWVIISAMVIASFHSKHARFVQKHCDSFIIMVYPSGKLFILPQSNIKTFKNAADWQLLKSSFPQNFQFLLPDSMNSDDEHAASSNQELDFFIPSMIYQKMMETAESHGGIADSHDAVLTVPLDFDEQQRQAVKSAAVKAGFNVLRIRYGGGNSTSAEEVLISTSKPSHHIVVASSYLRTNGLLGVLCFNITECQAILDLSSESKLEFVNLYEHVDRSWIIRPIGMRKSEGNSFRQDTRGRPYICRPKQKTESLKAYILILRKVHDAGTSGRILEYEQHPTDGVSDLQTT